MKKAIVSFCILTMAGPAARANGGGDSDDRHGSCSVQSTLLSETVKGPVNYHTLYGNVQHTNVTVQDFDFRTEAGDVIHVATAPIPVDLQALNGVTQRLIVDLTKTAFPNNAPSVQIAEIVTHVVSTQGVQFSDGTSCALGSPKTLSFYTAAPMTLFPSQTLLVVAFAPLNGLEIENVTKVIRTTYSAACNPKSHGFGYSTTCTKTEMSCKLANRRYQLMALGG